MSKIIKITINKKSKKRNYGTQLFAAFIVLSGIVTVIYESNKPTNQKCNEPNCTTIVNIQRKQPENIPFNLVKKDTSNIQKVNLDNVEHENNRLLLQRDIQRLVFANNPPHPFNYKKTDLCFLKLNKTKTDILIDSCTNHVFKRTIENVLKNLNTKQIVKKYKFKESKPQFEVRLENE